MAGEANLSHALKLITDPTRDNYKKAITILETILKSRMDTYGDRELNVRRRLGIAYFESCRYDEALNEFNTILYLYYQKGGRFKVVEGDDININNIKISDEFRYNQLLLSWTHHDAGVVLTLMKNYSAAKDHFDEAIRIIRGLKDSSTEAWFLNDLGWLYYDKGEVSRAIEQYNQTLQLNISDESFKSYYKAYPLFCLGLAYYKSDAKAYAVKIQDYFTTSRGLLECKAGRSADDDLLIAKIDMNLGRLHLNEGRAEDALSHLKSALGCYAKYGAYIEGLTPRRYAMERENIANTHFIYGKYYLDNDSIEGAEHEFGLALAASDSVATKAKFYNNMGYIHYKRGEHEKAADKFVLAAESDHTLKIALDNLRLLSESGKKAVGFSDFWFKDPSENARYLKSALAGLLMISILLNFIIIMFPASQIPVVGWGGYVNESTTEFNYNQIPTGAKVQNDSQKPSTIKIVEKRTKNFEYSLILIGLSILILLLPWIKSFQAGAIKMDLKEAPAVVTGGAGYPLGPPKIEM